MREILFRSKRLDNGEWVYGALLNTDDGKTRIATSYLGKFDPLMPVTVCTYLVNPDSVGQFTGLYDKNGVQIFEGDIVMKRTYNGKKPFCVRFLSGCFHCGWGGGSSTARHPYTIDDNQIQVIGNIHDNPELLS